jgi:predicted type IV restriction endonuclease
MAFSDDIARLAEQVCKRMDSITGEEATKQALILPFFNTLGYDVWDPIEVIPEYISDAAQKKAGQFEKVDYAIAINGMKVMLVEAKAVKQKAEAHDGQLKRYFSWTDTAKVGVITNGVDYRFFTDLRKENIMDDEPFFSFNVLSHEPKDIENLKFFHRDNFDAAAIGRHAEEMVYVKGMTQLVGNLLRSPSEEFIRFLVGQIGTVSPSYAIEGRVTSRVVEKFKPIVKKAIQMGLVDLMTRSITQEIQTPQELSEPEVVEEIEVEEESIADSRVETTAEELSAFEKIKTIAATSTNYRIEVAYRDVVAYFGVHVGNPRWWFLRLYLTSKRKSFVTRLSVDEVKKLVSGDGFEVQEMTASLAETTSRVVISSVNDLDALAPLILKCYETEAAKH